MGTQQNQDRIELSRLLVAADPRCDPHRLVWLCCKHAGREPLTLTLLVAGDEGSRAPDESAGVSERLACRTARLLDGAGLRLEDIVVIGTDGQGVGPLVRRGGFDALLVCAADDELPSPVAAPAARLARRNGLAVLDDGRQLIPARGNWLRRVVDPLLRRHGLEGQAT